MPRRMYADGRRRWHTSFAVFALAGVVMIVLRELPEMAPLLKDPRARRIVEQADSMRKGK